MVAQLLIRQLQDKYKPLQLNNIIKISQCAIIVLGGGHKMASIPQKKYILSHATKARLRYAVRLYDETNLPIITSGGKLNIHSPSEAKLMRKNIQAHHPIPIIWEENHSNNTKEESQFMVSILKKHHIKVAYLVTHAWHMPRAMYSFNYAFRNTKIKIIAAPMGYTSLESNRKLFNYLPTSKALEISNTAMHEYIGLLAYYLSNLI